MYLLHMFHKLLFEISEERKLFQLHYMFTMNLIRKHMIAVYFNRPGSE